MFYIYHECSIHSKYKKFNANFNTLDAIRTSVLPVRYVFLKFRFLDCDAFFETVIFNSFNDCVIRVIIILQNSGSNKDTKQGSPRWEGLPNGLNTLRILNKEK